MNTCSLPDFMEIIKPWLSSDYIQKASLDEEGRLILLFTDGIQNVYHIEDCAEAQLKGVLDDFKKRGIQVKG
ncbi:MAG: hypothetical protein D8M57_04390 [Candidatus Scalindua sp. AMX11]|nr:MAG: hypothetical protein DWQ00_04205 [Candidatus Scalindua sp.]NOG84645.1 hypothetical protein [Planctomycetota bacterium]RZV92418.1 MAG: hypothetical protein EX341_05050 [Candidatus Scalindua sp. SCAELEC01]TDE66055.1 MAG: hypothetical protein D8M57_04390 [Candidatus Scalindua sp. AMX11]GJQ59028.1 MAG: hypothetical protein SCALA701_18290 [Candidatus Scalindua sp.]